MTTRIESCAVVAPTQLWCAARSLLPRVRRLREQYFSFYKRDYTNEVRAYTTGTPWDTVYSIWSWTNVPEMAMFFQGARSYLLAASRRVVRSEAIRPRCRTGRGMEVALLRHGPCG